MKILVDVMGGDNAPSAHIEASVKAVSELDVDIVLIGDENVIKSELSKYGDYRADRISIVHAPEVISNHEEPVKAVKRKKDASVVVAAHMLKNGEGDAMLSMGNTGALLTAALLIVGRIKGIQRPALGAILPTAKGPKLLIDAGANTNCKPENLVQFAMMGDVYMRNIYNIDSPAVGLVSNGEEEGKGDDLTKKTHTRMKDMPFNFIGNIEGRDIMEGNSDVMVCDGFVGNVILKTIEGMGHMIGDMIKDMFSQTIRTKLGALFVMNSIKDFKKKMDYREYGGAPLLGCRRPVIKGHGSSDALAVYCAIKQAKMFVATDVIDGISKKLAACDLTKGAEEDNV